MILREKRSIIPKCIHIPIIKRLEVVTYQLSGYIWYSEQLSIPLREVVYNNNIELKGFVLPLKAHLYSVIPKL